MIVIDRFSALLADIRVAMGVAGATVGNALGRWWEWLPDNLLTKTATAVGIVLSCVLIYVHLKRHFRDEKLARLDMELKIQQLEKGGR